jgi:hypothetical protein
MSCGFPYCGGNDCANCHKQPNAVTVEALEEGRRLARRFRARYSDAELDYQAGRANLTPEGARHLLETGLGRPLTDAECWAHGLPDSVDRAMAADAPKCYCGGWSPREIGQGICKQCGRRIPQKSR